MRGGRLRGKLPAGWRGRWQRPILAVVVGLTVMIGFVSTLGSTDNSDAAPTKWTRPPPLTVDTTPPPPAFFSIAPGTSAPGGQVVVVAGNWYAGSAVTFTITLTTPTAGVSPRTYQWRAGADGSLREPFPAPAAAGLWQMCGKGLNSLQQTVSSCRNLLVKGDPVGAAAQSASAAPSSAPTTTLPSSDAGVPPTAEQDGITPVKESAGPAKSNTHRIWWLVEGVIAAIGLVVSYFMHHGQPTRHRRRVGSLILLVMVGGPLLMAIFVSPGPSSAPTLGLVRVQKTVSLQRSNSNTTVSAQCPAGHVVLGGGYVTDWTSSDRTSLDPLIGYLETTKANSPVPGELTYVRSLKWTSKSETGTAPLSQYWSWARADGSLHLADQIYDSKQETWKSVYDRSQPKGAALTKAYIDHGEETLIAVADTYYTTLDARTTARTVGVLVGESRPYSGEWRVVAQLPESSLQPEVVMSVTAICAPATTKSSRSGVRGARIVSASSGGNSAGSTHCRPDEVATSVGWQVGAVHGVAQASIDPATQNAQVYTGTATGNTAVLVCVPSRTIAVTSATDSASTVGGTDAGVKVACPAGTFVLGGGVTTKLVAPDGSEKAVPHVVLWSAPFSDTTFSVKVRGVVRIGDVKVPPATADGRKGMDGTGDFHVWSIERFTKNDRTDFTAQVICGRRI